MISKTSIALGLLLLAVSGCSEPPAQHPQQPIVAPLPPEPLPGMTKDSATIHNVEATRIWIIRGDGGLHGGEQRIIFCDAALLQGPAHELCTYWPPAPQPVAPPR